VDVIRLVSGREIMIRPIRPDDGRHLEAAYRGLSPSSQYQRFLAPKPRLSSNEVSYLTQLDGSRHCALLATPADDPNWILAVGRYVSLQDDPHAAEFAIVVGDPYQGEGIGTALMERLAQIAAEHGIERVTATMLATNRAAHRLMRHLAGDAHVAVDERHAGHLDEVEVALAA
jgi:RimJ/RimL family protein N-acetyltransferase